MEAQKHKFPLTLSWFNSAAGNSAPEAAHSPLPLPPVGWGGERTKGKTRGLKQRQFYKSKEILLLIMNMQSKLYTIQFLSLAGDWYTASPRAAIAEHETCAFCGTPQKKTKRMEKSELPEEKESMPAQPTPIHKLSTMSMVWNISTGQLGLAAWLCSLPAPVHLLISWIRETANSPWFHSNN